MKWPSPAAACLCLSLLGCGEGPPTNAAEAARANSAEGAPTGDAEAQSLVSGFTAADLAGMTVRDHPEGAQIVSPPCARGTSPPGMGDSMRHAGWIMYAPGVVFTEVNGMRVRNAAHFRELVNGIAERGGQRSLSHGGMADSDPSQAPACDAASAGLVSGFAASGLEGMAVRDHPDGAEVVVPPRGAAAEVHPTGSTVTSVNGTPVRNAAHLRELVNAAVRRGEEFSLGGERAAPGGL